MTDAPDIPITPELVLRGYAAGVFPMADSADDPRVYWVKPEMRGIIPLDGFHLSRSLRRRMLRGGYEVTVSRRFQEVVRACADRPQTWINQTIFDLYSRLFSMGFAHSIEVIRDGNLIGGVYGISLGGAFFGESMFSRETDGSKIALANLVAVLDVGGFTLLDTQFQTRHLKSLGAIEIPQAEYIALLDKALTKPAKFLKSGIFLDQDAVVQRITHTS